jgi:hypothetical protein
LPLEPDHSRQQRLGQAERRQKHVAAPLEKPAVKASSYRPWRNAPNFRTGDAPISIHYEPPRRRLEYHPHCAPIIECSYERNHEIVAAQPVTNLATIPGLCAVPARGGDRNRLARTNLLIAGIIQKVPASRI